MTSNIFQEEASSPKYWQAEFISPIDEEVLSNGTSSVDGTLNINESIARIILEGPSDILIDKSLKFKFRDSNNHDECKALIVGMVLSIEMGASILKEKNVSHLVANQVVGEYQTNEP